VFLPLQGNNRYGLSVPQNRQNMPLLCADNKNIILKFKKTTNMKFKSKTNKINNESRAMLVLRIIDTVIKSGIQAARVSKLFLQLEDVSARYQVAIEPGNDKQVKSAITALYKQRSNLFLETYTYLEGLLNSPDIDMKTAATMLFEQVSKYGKSFNRSKIADQSLRYIRIIESLKKPEYAAALTKTMLTEKVALLDQVQLDYEELYMGRGNNSATKVAPTSLRNELNNAIKLYMEEVNWMAGRENSEEWNTLKTNLQQRFDEVNVSMRKQAAASAEQIPTATTAA
jgi:hypothetical protein